MSIDSATIDLSKTFTYGQGYVALSRVRTLAGINLIGMNKNALMVHPDILRKDVEFKKQSYDAEIMFEKIKKDEMDAMHKQFIISNGGTIESVKREKTKKLSTHDATLKLFKQGLKLEEIARERNIKVASIIDHIYVLLERGDITNHEVLQLLDVDLSKDLNKIYTAFNEIGYEKLTPVYEHLKGRFTYEDLKLARIVYRTTLN
jgi:ATP-dependent DNA helicase PIF1